MPFSIKGRNHCRCCRKKRKREKILRILFLINHLFFVHCPWVAFYLLRATIKENFQLNFSSVWGVLHFDRSINMHEERKIIAKIYVRHKRSIFVVYFTVDGLNTHEKSGIKYSRWMLVAGKTAEKMFFTPKFKLPRLFVKYLLLCFISHHSSQEK